MLTITSTSTIPAFGKGVALAFNQPEQERDQDGGDRRIELCLHPPFGPSIYNYGMELLRTGTVPRHWRDSDGMPGGVAELGRIVALLVQPFA